jgi:phosphatidylinositol-3-phosphatase
MFSGASRIAWALLLCPVTGGKAAATNETPLPKIHHVFIIVLENEGYDKTFGSNSNAPYLSTMAQQGAILTNYYAIGHFSLPNYIAMISGQAPNPTTQADCVDFKDFTPRDPKIDADGQAMGSGCVYPAKIKTIADQLTEAKPKLRWRAYMEDMGNDPTTESSTCGHRA